MFKLSELISKPVFTVYEGIWLGTILDVSLDYKNKKIKGFFVLSGEEDIITFINKNNVYKIGESSLLIKNVSKIEQRDHEGKNVINLKALTTGGEDVGKIVDLYFDQNFCLTSLTTNKQVVIPFEKVLKVGKDAVFFSEKDEKISISSMKPRNKIKREQYPEIKVNILKNSAIESSMITGAEFGVIGEQKKEKKGFELPVKIVQNPSFLIGRIATCSIKTDTGEFIVKEGQKISEKAISKAQIGNKLYELSSCAN